MTYGKPVETEQRNSFGILWFATEKEADDAHKQVWKEGLTHNGGFMDGARCGRDKSWDKLDKDGYLILAVTY